MATTLIDQAQQTDRRIVRTQTALAEALIALTLEREYETITIRDLAARAGLGYATFFRHYSDKDALLNDVLEVVIAAIVDLLAPSVEQADHTTTGIALFRYAQAHATLCRVLLRGRATNLVLARFGIDALRYTTHWVPLAPPGIPPEIAVHHRLTATLALLQWWLEQEMPYTPEQMGAIYYQLIIQPTLAANAE